MPRNEVCSRSKTISTASAWVPGLASVGLGMSQPVQPARGDHAALLAHEFLDSQKHPPARTAVSAFSPHSVSPLLAKFCLRLVLLPGVTLVYSVVACTEANEGYSQLTAGGASGRVDGDTHLNLRARALVSAAAVVHADLRLSELGRCQRVA
jgi:hypothetical protein